MARKAEVTLWQLVKVRKSHRYVRMIRTGRSYAPKITGDFKLGAYYLRYLKSGRRTWESVGEDLNVALAEQRARQKALTVTPPVIAQAQKRTLRDAVSEFLTTRGNKNWRHILTVFGDWWGWKKGERYVKRILFGRGGVEHCACWRGGRDSDTARTKQEGTSEVAEVGFRAGAERAERGGVLPGARFVRIAFFLVEEAPG